MRTLAFAMAAAGAFAATSGIAQVAGVDLNGQYQCVTGCIGAPDSLAHVTQNGWELNIVDEAGRASRAWVNYPGRIWVDRPQLGAIYSPDGMTIQFDNGTVWHRYIAPPPPPPPPLRRRG